MTQDHNEWAKNLIEKHSMNKVALARTDVSLGSLNQLLSQGYTVVEWQTTSPVPCRICEDLARQQWELAMFLSGLAHEAPIFEHSHVNCYCTVRVRGEGLPEMTVDSYGNIG